MKMLAHFRFLDVTICRKNGKDATNVTESQHLTELSSV